MKSNTKASQSWVGQRSGVAVSPLSIRTPTPAAARERRPAKLRALACAVALLLGAGSAAAQISVPPFVTNVSAVPAPYPGTTVTITYAISDAVSTSDNVWVLVSPDGINWTVPAVTFSGTGNGLNVPVSMDGEGGLMVTVRGGIVAVTLAVADAVSGR